MTDTLLLAPGVTRLRPDDHFMILSETDASPMHVGALLVLAVPAADKPRFHAAMRRQLTERLAGTPLLARLEPFALDMWREDIVDLLPALKGAGKLHKETFFGGLYQKVVITP